MNTKQKSSSHRHNNNPGVGYSGIDRRREQRRQLSDRREMIRFELDKAPRRSGWDRRVNQNVWKDRERF